MLERKLVTLACAGGILACGACFLPPLPDRKPPAPPIALDLQGIKTIGVQVVNKSEVQSLSASDVASAIELRLATEGRRASLSAFPAEDGRHHDALLQVTIEKVSAAPATDQSNPRTVWDVNVTVSAILTRADGAVIWKEEDEPYYLRHLSKQEPAQDMWMNDSMVLSQVRQAIANRLVFRLLNVR